MGIKKGRQRKMGTKGREREREWEREREGEKMIGDIGRVVDLL